MFELLGTSLDQHRVRLLIQAERVLNCPLKLAVAGDDPAVCIASLCPVSVHIFVTGSGYFSLTLSRALTPLGFCSAWRCLLHSSLGTRHVVSATGADKLHTSYPMCRLCLQSRP